MDVNFKYLSRERSRHGKTVHYYRRDGRRVRIIEPIGTPEFAAAYAEISAQFDAGTPPASSATKPLGPVPNSLGWLSQRYQHSQDWLSLDASTRRARGRVIANMLEEPVVRGEPETFAAFPLHLIRLESLEVLRDRKRNLPAAAKERVSALRGLFAWAHESRLIKQNPANGLKRRKFRSTGHHTWTIAEIAQFEQRHPPGTKANFALKLLLYTGARRSDANRLGKQHMRDGWLVWTAHKNRNRSPRVIEIPILPALAEAIALGPSGDLVFVVTEFGKAFSAVGFSNWFKARCVEAGLPHCSTHGMRKAAATILAEAGATSHQLMGIFGWSSLAEAERYTQAAKRKKLAADGMALMKVSHLAIPGKQVRQIGEKNE